MKFYKTLLMTIGLLWQRKRISYQALKQVFDLDDAGLEALRIELIRVEQVAVDQDGEFLVWAGTAEAAASAPSRHALSPLKPLTPVRGNQPAAQAQAQAPVEASAEVVPLPVKAPANDAERRQLTVMFCDLVGSTALSTQLDPEDLRELIQAYQKTCAEVIKRYEGFIARYMGDGVLVYFGYPHATEFDAERALRTALGIVEAMQKLSADQNLTWGVELAVRIGLATGVVVVGDLIGEGASEERNVVGETPNLAARLQGLARPNGVVIGSVTKDLASDGFIYEDLGAHELKGITGQVKAWAVVSERGLDEGDISAQDDRPLVGRQEELGLLARAWAQSKAGQGQVVLISGEAGIGKTRLVEALGAEVKAAGFIRITLRCSPYHTNSALYPVIEHLQRVLGWQREDDTETKLDKLEQALSGYDFVNDETISLFSALFSLPLPARYPALTLTPQQQRQRTLDEIAAWLFEDAERQPMLQVWEDLNWADPTTLELLGLELEQCPTVSLMVAMTYRPEFNPPWPLRSHITPLTLNRLERVEVEQLIRHHAGGKALPSEVVEHIATKADGVPMYVEELTKAIIESDFLHQRDDHYELTGPLSTVSIPSTLQDSLTARLDRLPSGREVAQLGAVLGREFGYDMIRALSALEESQLHEGLNELVEAELLYQRGRPPRAKYIFKQALIQDAAYQLLLRRTRQQYHQQVAELFKARFPEIVETQPELVAHHYTEAGSSQRAVDCWQQAGQLASGRSAYVEAINHFGKALDLLRTLPETRERTLQELDLQVALGAALLMSRGHGAQGVVVAYDRAYELCQQLGDTPQLPSVLFGLWRFHVVHSPLPKSRELGEQLLRLAERSGEPTHQVVAHYALGCSTLTLGEPLAARRHLEASLAHYAPEQRSSPLYRAGQEPSVACCAYRAWALWLLGYPTQAARASEEALASARELVHPFSLGFALWVAGWVFQFRAEAPAAQVHAEENIALSSKHGFTQWRALALGTRGWGLVAQGQQAPGIAQLRQGLEAINAAGTKIEQPYLLALLAECYQAGGQFDEGLQALSDARELIDRQQERWWDAEVWRVKGELLLARSADSRGEADGRPAETCFHQALDIARQQQAKSLELRAATSLARLWQQQDKQKEAHELLAPVYDWFTEGFDTVDLKNAKVLLDELS